ncbi:P-loop containing nucleoside triphosphate hydrolase protein [Mycena floridula]|nr:P-loop containing nucleoside triphosphate hydrolase protein [Mycena floridula]
MSDDAVDLPTKKSKKSKSKQAASEPIDSVPAPANADKKKKKRKHEGDDADASNKKLKQAEENDDAEDEKIAKKERKKERRQQKADLAAAEAAGPSTANVEDEEKKAKQERKKEKKKRKAEQAAGESSSSPGDVAAFLEKHTITITVPPSTPEVTPVLSFSQLSIPEELSVAFNAKYTFKEPTPIQACTWPPALAGRDVVGIAETGSGKTLAFGVPALAQLITSPTNAITVLVLAPTRELAIQTHETLGELGKTLGIASVAVFGGVSKDSQIKLLKNIRKSDKNGGVATRIIVGTPGRIIDLINEGVCDLSAISYLVLDEADRMLDKGFENDIRKIIGYTKPADQRQTVMFSATWPASVMRLASSFLRQPVRVTVGSVAAGDAPTANKRVEQVIELLDDRYAKDNLLVSHLKTFIATQRPSQETPCRILVFVLYKAEGPRVVNFLQRHGQQMGVVVNSLHGDMTQSARLESLEWFKETSNSNKSKGAHTRVLVATDVASRGLDIPDVGLVLNYTFPLTVEEYVHRIGRTGRGGRTGKSITFFTGEDHERALAGELARVMGDSTGEGVPEPKGLAELRNKFPMTIKKKQHSAYGAFFREGGGEQEVEEARKKRKIVF